MSKKNLLSLVIAPDPRLSQRSIEVDKVDKELQSFMDDLLETMYYQDGAGIAAVQVGVLKRIFIVHIEEDKNLHPIFFINPAITHYSEEKCIKNEGCLSYPAQRIEIERASKIVIDYLDYHGNKQTLEAEGWLARAILHELDHLNGVTMPDHTSRMKKEMMIKKAFKVKKSLPIDEANSES